jgi:hypothetical protein
MAPNSAIKNDELFETTQTSADKGTNGTSRSNRTSPTVNVPRQSECGLDRPFFICALEFARTGEVFVVAIAVVPKTLLLFG